MVQWRKIKSNKDDKTYRKALTFEDTKQQKQTTTTFLSVKIKVNKINERNISRHDRYIFCYLIWELKGTFWCLKEIALIFNKWSIKIGNELEQTVTVHLYIYI